MMVHGSKRHKRVAKRESPILFDYMTTERKYILLKKYFKDYNRISHHLSSHRNEGISRGNLPGIILLTEGLK